MLFKKTVLQDILGENSAIGETVSDTIDEIDRWTVHHTLVFKTTIDGRFFVTGYRVGATEYQDERPFEFDPDDIECIEVVPTLTSVVKYLPRVDIP